MIQVIQVTAKELIEFVRAKGSFQLSTDKQQKPFTVRLNGNDLEFVPHSTKKPRAHELKWIQRVCNRFSQTNSYRPGDYSDLTVNASYTVAVIKAYLGQMPPVGKTELRTALAYERSLAGKIRKSLKDSEEARRKRLAKATKFAPIRPAITQIYLRNADVVVEVLKRANGCCEECKKPAPFTRKSDATPYLEVHHRKPLAEGGEDTVENAVAMCPNCHRKAHHG
jgi:hypothetical protein